MKALPEERWPRDNPEMQLYQTGAKLLVAGGFTDETMTKMCAVIGVVPRDSDTPIVTRANSREELQSVIDVMIRVANELWPLDGPDEEGPETWASNEIR